MSLSNLRDVERRIVTKLVVELIVDRECALSVFDGEGYAIERSQDVADVLTAVAGADADRLIVWRHGERLGFIDLIYGNGRDVIADYSVAVGELVQPVLDWAKERT